jgi:GNAT superfamily N-acetyltransferase
MSMVMALPPQMSASVEHISSGWNQPDEMCLRDQHHRCARFRAGGTASGSTCSETALNKSTMIRAAHPHEIRLLPQIENAADRRYARVGLKLVVDMPAHSIASLERGRQRGLLWVAASPRGRAVGFALTEIKGGTAWIEQLSVLDCWQGRGLGSALIDRCSETARDRGYESLYLTTYRGVAWNEPFYRRRGFAEVPRGTFSRPLRAALLTETSHGHPVWRRALMRR